MDKKDYLIWLIVALTVEAILDAILIPGLVRVIDPHTVDAALTAHVHLMDTAHDLPAATTTADGTSNQ